MTLELPDYQQHIIDSYYEGNKKIFAAWPRRSGKTLTALKFIIEQAMMHKGEYWFMSPYSMYLKCLLQGRELFESGTKSLINYIPKEFNPAIIKNYILLNNRSKILFVMDCEVRGGSYPKGIIFEEGIKLEVIKKLEKIYKSEFLLVICSLIDNHEEVSELYKYLQDNDGWYMNILDSTKTNHIIKKELNEFEYNLTPSRYLADFFPNKYIKSLQQDN